MKSLDAAKIPRYMPSVHQPALGRAQMLVGNLDEM
jgi:hypothetical protein